MSAEALGTVDFWRAEFGSFFEWCVPRLGEVLDAGGVRELWLQGEAYRYFRHYREAGPLCIWTNAHKRNDLAFYVTDADNIPAMIAELKLFGLNYLSKDLTGHSNLYPYRTPARPDGRFVFNRSHAAECHPREGSILKDYHKLLNQDGPLRLLMLVLDVRYPPNAFGNAIQRVDFGGPGMVLFESTALRATCWRVD